MTSLKKSLLSLTIISGIVAIFLFVTTDQKKSMATEPAKASQATIVNVEIVKSEPIQIWSEFSARLEAIGFAEIRPQVSGIITDIRFTDGQMVKKGSIIYVVDPRPFKAILDQTRANLAAAKNNASLAAKEYNRAKELIATKAISQRLLDERQNTARTAKDAVKSASALVEQAKVNVDYAYIKAPISGKISRAEIKVGNLVQPGPNAPLLTSIVATEGIYADFDVDEKTYVAISGDKPDDIPVQLFVGNGNKKYEGTIDSFDNRIDPTTGTIRARALFKNTGASLLPGMFATIKMGQSQPAAVITVPEIALGTDQDRKFVYVVGEDNVVAYRSVNIGEITKGRRVIKSGLNTDEKVIIEGLIKIRPGMPVSPQIKDQGI